MATAKQNNLLVPLIVFVVLWVVTGVTAFLFYQQTTKLDSDLTNAKKTAEEATKSKTTAEANLKKAKELIGYPEAEFGSEADAVGGTTLIAKIKEDLTKFLDPGTPGTSTYRDELARLAQRRDDLTKELTGKTDNYNQLRAEFETKRKVEEAKIGEHDANFQQANADRETVQKDVEQKLAENRRQMEDREQQSQDLADKKKQVEIEYERFRNRSDTEKKNLVAQVTQFKESVQRVQSSGTPVGSVVSVDNLNNEVYIDRGADDLLPLHTTFSVWSADKRGSMHWQEKNEKIKGDAKKELEQSGGRNVLSPRLEGGPKAYIEVVGILGPHQAKGRITLEKYTDPITPGDQLFTPLWSPGQRKHFALAGRFDLTGRGTNDRRLLIDMIKSHGGVIDAEVKDDGTIEGAIEVGTDYLVLGSMPDEGDSTEAQKDFAGRINATTKDLRKEARSLGVEVIDQAKLYDFMGYKPHSRIYEPGGFTGGPEPTNRFENPSQSTRPSTLPGYENPSATTRPSGIPGKSSK